MAHPPAPSARRGFALLVPRASLSKAEFEQYWLHRHGSLVATTPGYGQYRRTYTQDHVAQGAGTLIDFPFAGVASVVHPRVPGGDFSHTRVYRERIEPDERRFLDRDASAAFGADEYTLIPGGETGATKILTFGMHVSQTTGFHFAHDGMLAYADWVIGAKHPPIGWSLSLVVSEVRSMNGGGISVDRHIDWVSEWRFESAPHADEFLSRHDHPAEEPNRYVRTRWTMPSDEHVLFDDGSR